MRRTESPAVTRTLALSDGVFAIAITLLVLDLKVPDLPEGADTRQLLGGILGMADAFIAYLVSFAVIGLYWVAHHRCFEKAEKVDGRVMWINLAFLFLISFIPYPTKVLSRYGNLAFAVQLYALNIAAAGFGLWALWSGIAAGSQLRGQKRHAIEVNHYRRLRTPALFLASAVIAIFDPKLAQQSWWLLALLPIFERRVLRLAPET